MENRRESSLLKSEILIKKAENIQIKDQKFDKIMFLYTSALKQLEEKINLLKEEFRLFYNYTLIDHTMSRMKRPESIIKKMQNRHYALTYQNMVEKINDIAGIRIICPLKDDIFIVKELLANVPEIRIINEKDYITKPKKSGYSSYHMIVEVPVNLVGEVIYVKAEIQIRTMAMDFWASLEHEIKYKPKEEVSKRVSKELIACAKKIRKLDNKMVALRNTQ